MYKNDFLIVLANSTNTDADLIADKSRIILDVKEMYSLQTLMSLPKRFA